MSRTGNRSTFRGAPPGVPDFRRVSGLLAGLAQEALNGSMSSVTTTLHRQSILVAKFFQQNGCYPSGPLDVSTFTPADQVLVATMQMTDLKKNKKGYGTPRALLCNTPWFPAYFKSLIQADKDAVKVHEKLKTLEKVFVVKAQDTVKLRTFVEEKAQFMHTELQKHISQTPYTKCLVYGGGDKLYKERRVMTNMVGKEVDEPYPPETAECSGVLAINSLTHKTSENPEEIMAATAEVSGGNEQPVVVTVVPLKEPADPKRRARYQNWAELDSKQKMERFMGIHDMVPGIPLRHGENALLAFFAPRYVDLKTDDKADGTDDTTFKVYKRVKKGEYLLKPKIDGELHHLVVREGKAKLYPRTLPMESFRTKNIEYRVERASGDSPGCDFHILLELAQGNVWHIVRIIEYGAFRFHSENPQANCNLEENLNIILDGRPVKFCGYECRCPIDGVFFQEVGSGANIVLKSVAERDVYARTEGRMKYFRTEIAEGGNQDFRLRAIGVDKRKLFQENFQVTIHPSVYILDWQEYLVKRPRAQTFTIDKDQIRNATASPPQVLQLKCDWCGSDKDTKFTRSCRHGTFCHADTCWDCADHELSCAVCDGKGSVECPEKGAHCGKEECVCNAVRDGLDADVLG